MHNYRMFKNCKGQNMQVAARPLMRTLLKSQIHDKSINLTFRGSFCSREISLTPFRGLGRRTLLISNQGKPYSLPLKISRQCSVIDRYTNAISSKDRCPVGKECPEESGDQREYKTDVVEPRHSKVCVEEKRIMKSIDMRIEENRLETFEPFDSFEKGRSDEYIQAWFTHKPEDYAKNGFFIELISNTPEYQIICAFCKGVVVCTIDGENYFKAGIRIEQQHIDRFPWCQMARAKADFLKLTPDHKNLMRLEEGGTKEMQKILDKYRIVMKVSKEFKGTLWDLMQEYEEVSFGNDINFSENLFSMNKEIFWNRLYPMKN